MGMSEKKEKIEKETQDTFWYPPLEATLYHADVWQKREIGFYIHIPFCKTVCKYCPFNKYAWKPSKIEGYLQALFNEMELLAAQPYIKDSTFVAGYLGGGTPTALSTAQLREILARCRLCFDMAPDAEISVEANPETVDEEKLTALLEMGVNRLSLGAQTFDDRFLKLIGRFHRRDQAVAALDLARRVGHQNINIDLLYYLPGQTLDEAAQDLQTVIDLRPQHVTAYPLIVSEGTRLLQESRAGKVPPQGEPEIEDEMSRLVGRRLRESGYNQYLVWDFALPGGECLHHRLCLEPPHREYIGLGAGAYSHIRGCTYLNLHRLEAYEAVLDSDRLPISYGKRLTVEDEMHRYLVLGIYFVTVSKGKFKERFGVELDAVFGRTIERLVKLGWLTNEAEAIRLTEEGKIYISNVSNAFYAGRDRDKAPPIPVVLQQQK
jgi:oxygen-independent coproporphyrinogen-3 oxidase